MSVTDKEAISDYNNSLNDIVTKFLSISHEIKELFQQTIASHFAVDEGDSRLLRWLWTDELSFDGAFLKLKNLMNIRYEKYAREYDYVFLELEQFSEMLNKFLHKVPNSKHNKLECAKESKVYFVNDSNKQMEYSLDDLRYKIVILQKSIIPAVKQICSDVKTGAAKEIESS